MKMYQDFVNSVLSLEGMDGAPEKEDFYLAMADVVIFLTLRDAARANMNPDDLMENVMAMFGERYVEWTPTIRANPTML